VGWPADSSKEIAHGLENHTSRLISPKHWLEAKRCYPGLRQFVSRRPTVTKSTNDQATLQVARRLVELRRDHFGEHGSTLLAILVGVSQREWSGYETSQPVPMGVLRRVAEITDTHLEWLRTGRGSRAEERERLDLGLGEGW
jgi:hypothetical protein